MPGKVRWKIDFERGGEVKVFKILLVVFGIYIGIVVVFESLLGYFQPANDGTLVITTTNAKGEAATRVLSKIDVDGTLYVAANHWPRDWYRDVLARPDVFITLDAEPAPFTGVKVDGAEHTQVDAARPLPLVFRILTGFPPRYFIRLDPVVAP